MKLHTFCKVFLVLLSVFCGQCIDAANILNLMGCPSPSVHLWNSALVNAIAARGHNVTVLSTNKDPQPPANVHYILLEGVYDFIYKNEELDLVSLGYLNAVESIEHIYTFSTSACEGIKRSRGLQTLLNYPKNFKFDLIVYDYTLGPCLLGFLHRFNYPVLIGATPFNNPPYTPNVVGGHNQFSYQPYLTSKFTNKMTIGERFYNLVLYAVDHYYREYYLLPALEHISKEVFGSDCPNVKELEQRTQIALVSTHPSLDFAEPLPPNVIPIGGLQIADPKPLPNDIEGFIAAGKEGTVLFSLGTNIKSKDLGRQKQQAILRAFDDLPQYNFIWKFEAEEIPFKLPPNVMVRKWLRQNDILNHSNIKAFVTHGGSMSTYETSWYGVPTVGIPFIIDQYTNVHKSVTAGVSEWIRFEHLSADELKSKLLMVLTNPSYKNKMAKRSRLLRDQPERPIERAVWYVEYLLRNPDASHLRTPTIELGFIRSNSLD
ncbi:UDP-glucosyltransferase 2, partial [Pseudolycoriella hygida]